MSGLQAVKLILNENLDYIIFDNKEILKLEFESTDDYSTFKSFKMIIKNTSTENDSYKNYNTNGFENTRNNYTRIERLLYKSDIKIIRLKTNDSPLFTIVSVYNKQFKSTLDAMNNLVVEML